MKISDLIAVYAISEDLKGFILIFFGGETTVQGLFSKFKFLIL
jgi:hypothetical protein